MNTKTTRSNGAIIFAALLSMFLFLLGCTTLPSLLRTFFWHGPNDSMLIIGFAVFGWGILPFIASAAFMWFAYTTNRDEARAEGNWIE